MTRTCPVGVTHWLRLDGSASPRALALVRSIRQHRPHKDIRSLTHQEHAPQFPRSSDRSAARRADHAVARLVDTKRHRARLVGDLDWITMRAIEKDATRLYGSVEALAADIRRHLAHEPVSAAAPSVWYRTRKFVRRHRVGVPASLVVLLAAAAGLIVTLVSLARTTRWPSSALT